MLLGGATSRHTAGKGALQRICFAIRRRKRCLAAVASLSLCACALLRQGSGTIENSTHRDSARLLPWSWLRQDQEVSLDELTPGDGEAAERGWEGEAKECRRWKETDLAFKRTPKHKFKDNPLEAIAPERTPGVEWSLVISDALQGAGTWLGPHNHDGFSQSVHGSEAADRVVARYGYCRVHMPSIPRTGSTWFRAMFEVATGQPTASMWNEGSKGTKHLERRYFMNYDPCGASLDDMEGWRKPNAPPHICRNVKPPGPTDSILVKSHTPFLPSYDRPALFPESVCAVLLLVRNPLDAHDAWTRYAGASSPLLRDYLPKWAGHINHWIVETTGVPLIAFRYEDLLYRPAEVLEMILTALGPGWTWSKESIEKAVELFGPKKKFETKCGASITSYPHVEVEMVRRHYSGMLSRFGYAIEEVEPTDTVLE